MNDEELYLKATNEVEGDSKDPALWAKATAAPIRASARTAAARWLARLK